MQLDSLIFIIKFYYIEISCADLQKIKILALVSKFELIYKIIIRLDIRTNRNLCIRSSYRQTDDFFSSIRSFCITLVTDFSLFIMFRFGKIQHLWNVHGYKNNIELQHLQIALFIMTTFCDYVHMWYQIKGDLVLIMNMYLVFNLVAQKSSIPCIPSTSTLPFLFGHYRMEQSEKYFLHTLNKSETRVFRVFHA